MTGRMRQQTEAAVAEAAAVLFVIDARAGVTPLDAHFANWLRRQGRPVILLANKCEGGAGRGGMAEAYGLGFGAPLPVSAEHGQGPYDLAELLGDQVGSAGGLGAEGDELDPHRKDVAAGKRGAARVGTGWRRLIKTKK